MTNRKLETKWNLKVGKTNLKLKSVFVEKSFKNQQRFVLEMFKVTSIVFRSLRTKQIEPLLQGSFLRTIPRNFICSSVNLNQQEQLSNIQIKKESIEDVKFLDQEKILSLPLARNFLLQNLNLKAAPTEIKTNKDVLEVTWNDGHSSTFDSAWLYERAFNDQARTKYDKLYRLPMKPWGKNLQLRLFNYEDLMRNDSSLLNWLLTMEVTGATLIKNCPNDLEAGPKLSEKIGFVKMTHYGRRSPVVVRPDSNNIAFTSVKLGLHNDIPQYIHQPGIILLHTLEQHRGVGGESTISDGFLATEILRKENPRSLRYFSKHLLNRENKFEIMRVNNQVTRFAFRFTSGPS
ncbi:Gamma-butyrobetaine dioxygenase [Armadillidium nasatum]|uniref:Gamma-butyrobetaine dioxygenase n=1 Tax=Armadillidium nasatum TaxID=96803 RepID=A0A5N5SMD1_9CRUS|nr:Gamma-butyrobetaine dioxygenase [Armadillidium nasatum]